MLFHSRRRLHCRLLPRVSAYVFWRLIFQSSKCLSAFPIWASSADLSAHLEHSWAHSEHDTPYNSHSVIPFIWSESSQFPITFQSRTDFFSLQSQFTPQSGNSYHLLVLLLCLSWAVCRIEVLYTRIHRIAPSGPSCQWHWKCLF